MKAVFVVLHYLTASETLACVESLVDNLDDSACEYEIVVVDNFSNNGSLELLQNAFAAEQRVQLLPLPANLGFARGNNAGYQMAKTRLQADFILMINNDTVIEQPDFLTQMVLKYQADPFDILGPDIVTPDHRHQNPKALAGYDAHTLARKIRRVQRDLWLTRTSLYNVLIMMDRLKRMMKPAPEIQSDDQQIINIKNEKSDATSANIVPHGSCLVFSPSYVQKYRGIYSGTFLYCEEEILWYIAQQEKLRIVFWPIMQIQHKEDRATLASTRTAYRKRLFKLNHELDSLRQLQAMMINPKVYQEDLL